MIPFILKRLALAVPTMIAISFLVFVVARLAPSSPVEIMLGQKATKADTERLEHEYGLDRPFLVQYVDYVTGIVLHGDFGRSFARGGQPISEMIAEDFPNTARLALFAFAFAMGIGLPAGVVAATFHDRWPDRVIMAIVVAMVSVPSMVLGPVLVLFFAVRLGWVPPSGWDSPVYWILPTVTLGSRTAAVLARFMRSSLLDVLRQDYMRTAIAKGLSRSRAIWRHGLKNAFLPVLTVLGTNFGYLLTGSFVVETIFQVPGIGYESINSITKRDYPVIQGMALLVAAIFILVNLTVDILYGAIDPRVRTQEEAA